MKAAYTRYGPARVMGYSEDSSPTPEVGFSVNSPGAGAVGEGQVVGSRTGAMVRRFGLAVSLRFL
jgi:hypothetical protein